MNHTLQHISKFEQVGNYFVSLVYRIKQDRKNIEESWYQPINIDRRIKESKFFYFPNECNFNQKNCFEQNFDFFLALQKIYPNSNPKLINLLLDDVNLHSAVLFTHNKEVYFADPVKKKLGNAQLMRKSIKIKKNLTNLSKNNNLIKFEKIFQIQNSTLEKIITNLREPQGIIDFFYGSGQIASRINEWPYHKELFIHIDEDFNIHGQIRTEDSCPSENNSLIKLIYNPFKHSYSISTHQYSKSNWQKIINTKSLNFDITPNPASHFEITIKVAQYLKQTNMSFRSNSNLENKINELDNIPKDFREALKFDSEVLNYYLDYCLEEDKNNFGISKSASELLIVKTVKIKDENIEIPSFKFDTNLMFKEINDRNRFQLFRLAYDFKKYAEEISKNL